MTRYGALTVAGGTRLLVVLYVLAARALVVGAFHRIARHIERERS